ncbi:MAG TPA: ribosomal-protein-alanine N-acetyltransferase [Desulfobacterales bacterium]|nr:ribosomal-protein-alanine N-acetyltransferase [Desulfobacterales bacterium]
MSGADIRCPAMTAADMPEVWRIEQSLPGPWTFNQLRDELQLPLGWHFTLKSAAGIHGYIFGITIAGEAEIRKLAIHQDFRRQGLGHKLLKQAWRHLTTQKAAACFLEVREKNTAATALYRKNLFQTVGSRPDYYKLPPDNAVILRKNLSGGQPIQTRGQKACEI